MTKKRIYLGFCIGTLAIVLATLLVILPLVVFAQTPTLKQVFVQAAPDTTAGQITLDHLAALASFYQTVIAILVTVIGLLATLSFLTIRHISKTAAEDMAVDAARKVIADSREFEEDVALRVEESVRSALEDVVVIKDNIEKITKAVSNLDGRVADLTNNDHVSLQNNAKIQTD